MPFFNARKMLNSTLPSFLAALSLGGPASCSAAAQAVADVCPPLGSALTGGPAASHGCAALELAYPGSTFFPGEEVYEYEAQAFWSNTQLMNPGCVFRPLGAQEVACAVAAAKATNSEFAVRGGGHMGIRGANNIDDGVLMVMSNLTTLEYSESDQVLTLGPGHTWGAVYKYLSQFDRAVAGGRLSPVGVPGLLLAGGVNFHANQHGWSADNVLEYEVVLADGSIAKATADENADLFWALKGGSSNFGIVTQFKLRTFESTQVWAGTHTVTGDHIDEMFAAVADFTLNNKDAKSHIVPMTIAMSPEMTVVSVILFYDSPTVAAPECFSKILAIPAIANSCGFKTLSDFAFETGALVYDKINDLFIAGTTVGRDYDALLQGLRITNDVFFAALPELYAQVPPANLSLVSIDWQPITPLWQVGSRAANPGGSPLDSVDPAAKGSYLAWAEVVEWVGSEYDAAVLAWVEKTTAAINDATKAAGLFDPFNYMGDAAGFQEVYAGYGAENQKRLLDISRKYDPERVFQNLLPGGFKIGQ